MLTAITRDDVLKFMPLFYAGLQQVVPPDSRLSFEEATGTPEDFKLFYDISEAALVAATKVPPLTTARSVIDDLLRDYRYEGCRNPKCLVCIASNKAEKRAKQFLKDTDHGPD